MEPFVVSIVFYSFVLLICEVGRLLVRGNVFNYTNRLIFTEFLGTLQLCACLFENGFVLKHYGLIGFFVALSLLIIIHSKTIDTALADPCPLIRQFLQRQVDLPSFLGRFSAQLAGAFFSYKLAKLFWLLEISSDHSRSLQQFHCHSDLTVTPLVGCLLEMTATWLSGVIFFEAQRYGKNYGTVIGALGAATITCIGLNYTGMYCDPILATAKMFGCKGVDIFEHFVVYWLGPFLGHLLPKAILSGRLRLA